MKHPLLSLLLATGICASPVIAQEQIATDEINIIGVIVAGGESVYDDTSTAGTEVYPLVYYRDGKFKITGKEATYDLASYGDFTISALGDLRIAGYDENETGLVQGMADRENTLELGGQVSYRIGNFEARAKTRVDVLGKHEGYDIALESSYEVQPWLGNFTRAYGGVAFRSEDLTNYYFGVEADEVIAAGPNTAGRAAYAPGEATVPYIGVLAGQALSEKIMVGVLGHYQWLPNEIADSPIVDRDNEAALLFMIGYVF